MSLTLKIGSLFIRTLAKPIANAIKRNAREHERFRRICVGFAQGLHRIDIRLKLGLLQDPAVIDRQIAREVAEAEAKRKKALAAADPNANVPTAKTEAETKAAAAEAKDIKKQAEKEVARKNVPRIRPLSESKAIETGANFISESFMFMVAGSIILFEAWRSRRKESSRREDVADRLDRLENEKEELKEKVETLTGLLEEKAGREGEGSMSLSARAAISDLEQTSRQTTDSDQSPTSEGTIAEQSLAEAPRDSLLRTTSKDANRQMGQEQQPDTTVAETTDKAAG